MSEIKDRIIAISETLDIRRVSLAIEAAAMIVVAEELHQIATVLTRATATTRIIVPPPDDE